MSNVSQNNKHVKKKKHPQEYFQICTKDTKFRCIDCQRSDESFETFGWFETSKRSHQPSHRWEEGEVDVDGQ